MSYSRWGNSCWYTYWCAIDSMVRTEQELCVTGDGCFSYKELKSDLKGCLKRIKDSYKGKDGWKPTNEEMRELKKYMKQFIKDVKNSDDLVDLDPELDDIGHKIVAKGW